MDQQAKPLPEELIKVNKKIVFFEAMFLVTAVIYGFLSYNDAYYGLAFLEDLLNFAIKDPNTIRVIMESVRNIFAPLFILSFILILYFLDKKEKIKKQYNIKGPDSTDVAMRDNLFKYFGNGKVPDETARGTDEKNKN